MDLTGGGYTDFEADPDSFVSPHSLPQQLGLLQELHLRWVYVHPDWLARLTTLRKLDLADVVIDDETSEDDVEDYYDSSDDIKQLLRALARFTQLEVWGGGACCAVWGVC